MQSPESSMLWQGVTGDALRFANLTEETAERP